MKIVKKNIYYCDFCKKKSLRSLVKHEVRCTGNVNRYCGLCDDAKGKNIPKLIEGYKERYQIIESETLGITTQEIKWLGYELTIKEVKKAVDDCPNCVLTILRGLDFEILNLQYDYKNELGKWKLDNWGE